MNIRDFAEGDRAQFLAMSQAFYGSSAVTHAIPMANAEQTFDLCVGGSPLARGLLLEHEGAPAGFALLALTHSNEAGGLVVWLEELYVLPAMQGKGIGSAFLTWLLDAYPQAARFRLEVSQGNEGAAALYRRLGFVDFPYRQMTLDRRP